MTPSTTRSSSAADTARRVKTAIEIELLGTQSSSSRKGTAASRFAASAAAFFSLADARAAAALPALQNGLMPPIKATDTGLWIAPSSHNFVLASAIPAIFAICCMVDWSDLSPTASWLLFCLDHYIAFQLTARIVKPLLRHNVSSSTDVPADLAALRATTAIALSAVIVHGVAHYLGRTALVSIAIMSKCVKLQIACWTASVATRLQGESMSSCMLSEPLRRLLDSSALDLLDKFQEPPTNKVDLISLLRGFIPLLLLGPEAREEALALLSPEVVSRLRRPLVDWLPAHYREMLHEPWQEAERLRLRRGVPAATATSPPSDPPAATSTGPSQNGPDDSDGFEVVQAADATAANGSSSAHSATADSAAAAAPPPSPPPPPPPAPTTWSTLGPEVLMLKVAGKRVARTAGRAILGRFSPL